MTTFVLFLCTGAALLALWLLVRFPDHGPGEVTKALLHVAKLLEESHQAKDWGIEFAAPKIDLARLRSWKEAIVKKLHVPDRKAAVRLLQGRATG